MLVAILCAGCAETQSSYSRRVDYGFKKLLCPDYCIQVGKILNELLEELWHQKRLAKLFCRKKWTTQFLKIA